ncbi:MAG TPA: DUF1259 domain-containing protein [Puia sp.]|jgi:hypothetical protein|nr:DUF1259 domain-containing protein [Puia sp.]
MKIKSSFLSVIFVLYAILCFAQIDSTGLNNVFGKNGSIQGMVYRITYPRSDLKVKVNEFQVAPGLALTSWIGILFMGNESMMMGDLVLLDTEEAEVVNKLVASKLFITAIHNHLTNEKPAIKYIHFSGSGDPLQLAASIKSVLAITGTPLSAPVTQQQNTTPDWSRVEAVLGKSGKHNGQLLQFSFPRKEKLLESGMEMPPSIGMATGINFQMDGIDAGITGDFVLLANEVNPVVKALTENGITVTAIHNHMLYEDPRLFMLHFWAVSDPEKLAIGLKAALDKTNSKM